MDTIQLLVEEEGALEFFNWTTYLFHFLSGVLFYALSQAKYVFHFLRLFSVHKVGSQTRFISIDLEVEETSKAKLHKFISNLMMPCEERLILFRGH